ncbi:MAG TPA: MFS transporter [Actinocrinis sp.]|nr:MFS transporter [Actinocrinis sp.]
MLLALAVDRTGSGMWSSSSVLYFTFVAHLTAGQIGLLLGVAGLAGIVGSPVAGRLAGRFPVRPLLIGCHLLRLAAVALLPLFSGFGVLIPLVAATYLGDRAAKMLEMLFAARTAGPRRGVYQALSRSSANAGYAVGAGIAAVGVALGTADAYRTLILGDALSFAVAASLVWRTREPRAERIAPAMPATPTLPALPAAPAMPMASELPARRSNPWRDRGYLLFVLLDIPMCIDDSVLNVGLPLWLVTRTSAPHALVPGFLIVNTVMVVALQVGVSSRAEGPRGATRAVLVYGLMMCACCAAVAAATRGGAWVAAAVLLTAALLDTMAELMRSVSSWELAVLLAPEDARAPYLGVAGMSQSIQKSAGPPLLTGVVMAAGSVGWVALGLAAACLAVVQRAACARRLQTIGEQI